MTKRFAALLLAAALALCAPLAQATDLVTYTLEEKFLGQAAYSGLTGTARLTLSETPAAAAGAAAWQQVRALADVLTLDVSYANRKDTQLIDLSLMQGDALASRVQSLAMGDLRYLRTDFLGTGWIALRNDVKTLCSLLKTPEGAWPSLLPVALSALLDADAQWHERFAAALTPYNTKLSLWLQAYAQVEIDRTNTEAIRTVTRFTIPIATFKAEMKQLLVDFFDDEALLALLAERAGAEQAAAYLQPGARQIFFDAIDSLPLAGEISVRRAFNMQGVMTESAVTLPLAPEGMRGLTGLEIVETQEDGVKTLAVTAQFEPGEGALAGASIAFTLERPAQEGERYFTGSLCYTPETLPEDAWAVGEDADGSSPASSAAQGLAFTYNAAYGSELATAADGAQTGTYQVTLVIKPDEQRQGEGWLPVPAQTVTAQATLQSKASRNAATHVQAALSWRELDTQAQAQLAFTGRTTYLSELEQDVAGAVRIDLMEDTVFSAWLEDAQQTALATLARLFGPLVVLED